MGNAVNQVPIDDPVAMAIAETAKNTKNGYNPALTPNSCANHTNPPERFDSRIRVATIPTTNRMTTIDTAVRPPIPRMTWSQYSLYFLANSAPKSRETNPPIAKAVISKALKKTKNNTQNARNATTGTKAV